MKKGRFIVVEGTDGSGKTTQISLLKKEMPDVLFVREPGGTTIGEQIRSILLSKENAAMTPETEIEVTNVATSQGMSTGTRNWRR